MTVVLRDVPSSTLIAMVGLGVGGTGILLQFVAAPDSFGSAFGVPFPPGLVYVAGAMAILWLDRRSTWSPMAAVALASWIVVGGLLAGDLAANLTDPDQLLVAGNLVMVVGLLSSVVASVIAVLVNRRAPARRPPRPLSAGNPRRGYLIATVVGLVAAGAGLAAAERLDFQGPGAIPFALLALAVAFTRGTHAVGLSLVLCIVYLGATLSNPQLMAQLANAADPFGVAATASYVVFLLVTIAAGILANTQAREGSPAVRAPHDGFS